MLSPTSRQLRPLLGLFAVLRAADVVKDRLNKYVAYEDPESFEVAVAVARMKTVDLSSIEAFIERQTVDVASTSFRMAFARLRNRLGLQRREISSIGFTTAFRLRFRSEPSVEIAEAVARGIQALLDEERVQIDAMLDGITIRQAPQIEINTSDRTLALMPLALSTKRNLAPVDRFALAVRIVEHTRARIEAFPELAEIPDDGTPPVATSGF